MVHAFVMVKTEAGEGERLLDAIRQVVSVTEAHIVAGNYDIIAEMDTEEVYDVLKSIKRKTVEFEYHPGGEGAGLVVQSGDCILTSFNVQASVNSQVQVSGQFQITGGVTEGTGS